MLTANQANEIANWSVYSVTIISTIYLVFYLFGQQNMPFSIRNYLVHVLGAIIGWIFYFIVTKRLMHNVFVSVPDTINETLAEVIKYGTVFIVARVVIGGLNNEQVFDYKWTKYFLIAMIGYFSFELFLSNSSLILNADPKTNSKIIDIIRHTFVFMLINLIANEKGFMKNGSDKCLIGIVVGLIIYHFQVSKLLN
jgi:hypothetical protein